MALSVLSQASAFNPGADLWIVPDLEKSPWTAKLDWYLNFQICKASRHVAPVMPPYVTEVLRDTELNVRSAPPLLDGPLMVSSQNLLPNKWVVVLPWAGDLSAWSAQIYEIWSRLKEPSLRIFLPPGQSTGSLQLAWQSHHPVPDLTAVLD